MRDTWITEPYDNALGGVSSAVDPRFLNPSQLAWAKDVVVRGGTPGTRPAFRQRLILPPGIVQGAHYFSVQNGMIVVSIAGNIYRLRVANNSISTESIPLAFRNSAVLQQCWMTQTVESLIIQDGQSAAIIYNGSSARRSNPAIFEVPLGRQMAYGDGRLWVAINQFNVVAGDIRTDQSGSELKFTETTYLSGGGALYFPRGVNGLAFVPTVGGGDYGTLMIFGIDFAVSVRADISARDLWAQMPGFSTTAFRNIGCASQNSIVEVNQDLYWRDNEGGIRSLRSANADEMGPGNAAISREVSRIIDYESHQFLSTSSGIYFENRLLMTASPYLNRQGGVSFKNLVSLDFAPISTMAGKSSPVFDGQWEGLAAAQVISGKFSGRNRAFVISSDEDGSNRLWEIESNLSEDFYRACADASISVLPSPILCQVEYARRDFGEKRKRKRLTRFDVYITDLADQADLKVFWRADNDGKWHQWDEKVFCANIEDPSTAFPHVFKNLSRQQRPQIKSFTIPDGTDEITKYATELGFEFQFKVVWTGDLKIYKSQAHAELVVDSPYAEELDAACLTEDLTGNEETYSVPLGVNSCVLTTDIACRSREGSGGIIGYAEFGTPSVPPRLYRTKTFSGGPWVCEEGSGSCVCSGVKWNITMSGNNNYDVNTTILTQSAIGIEDSGDCSTYSLHQVFHPLESFSDIPLIQAPFIVVCETIISKTLQSAVPGHPTSCDTNCYPIINGQFLNPSASSIIYETLSNEDTEQDAINRAFPDPNVDWSDWADPADGGCCTTSLTARGSGVFTFDFRQVEFWVTGTGGFPGAVEEVQVPVYRRLIGDTTWTLWQTLVYEPTVASDGTVSFTALVPQLAGYETYVDQPGTCT